ncbi:MAG: tRNA-dependent cyclodipeptide synthase [Alphaproteobacteria bacterium]|nr:tRNA-dependent cyclodipeptide synthase [Alphaproteobacteria bacterium]
MTFALCVGNPNWEGAKLEAILEWASRHFDLIRIAVSDTLGRHNYLMRGFTPEKALQMSSAEGDSWLKEHMHQLRLCGKPCEIVRWDKWRFHPEFNSIYDRYRDLAHHDKDLSKSIEKYITEYLKKLHHQGEPICPDGYQHCFEYVIEELAGTTLRARAFGRSCRIYPAPEADWIKLVRNQAIADAPSGLEQEYYVAFNLRRRKETSIFCSSVDSALSHHIAA